MGVMMKPKGLKEFGQEKWEVLIKASEVSLAVNGSVDVGNQPVVRGFIPDYSGELFAESLVATWRADLFHRRYQRNAIQCLQDHLGSGTIAHGAL